MVSEVTVLENSKQTLLERVTVQELVVGFWTVTSNHKVKELKISRLTETYLPWLSQANSSLIYLLLESILTFTLQVSLG